VAASSSSAGQTLVSREIIGDNKNPNSQVVEILAKEAEKYARDALDGLSEKLVEFADYITLGIDSIQGEDIDDSELHRSSLILNWSSWLNLTNHQLHWTGKSYPTPSPAERVDTNC